MVFKNEFEQTIIKILLDHPEGVQIGYILPIVQRSQRESLRAYSKETIRKRVYRLLEKWTKSGIVKKEKIGNRYNLYRLVRAKHVINLIKTHGLSKIQTQTLDFIKTLEKIDEEKVTGRLKALKLLLKETLLSDETKEKIIDEFLNHISDTNEKRLLFKLKEEYSYDPSNPNEYLILPYLHRFNNPQYWKKYNYQVKSIFREASKRYKWAVHLTLTIDPEQFNNAIELFYEARRQINSFLTNIRNQTKRKKGTKLSYVRFNEFTENGLLHFHIILFGRRYIKPVEQIAKYMWKLGFVFAYQLVNRKGKWTYPRKRPHDYFEKIRKLKQGNSNTLPDGAGFMHNDASAYFYFTYPKIKSEGSEKRDKDDEGSIITAEDYEDVDKYYLLNFALLWAFNLRARTQSRDLLPPKKQRPRNSVYEFIGAYYTWRLDEILDLLGLNISGYVLHFNPQKKVHNKVGYDPPPSTAPAVRQSTTVREPL